MRVRKKKNQMDGEEKRESYNHKIHLTPLTTPFPTPLMILNTITINHNHHITPTSVHSNNENPILRIDLRRRFRFRSPLSRVSLSCLISNVLVVLSCVLSASASRAAVLTLGVKWFVMKSSRVAISFSSGNKVDFVKRYIDLLRPVFVFSRRSRRLRAA